ncbi:putative hydrolase or acyltransferase [Alloalcanivorax dieselolei B5]|uniref:Putative hydrolase or acyltransferase n=1 Tax=Alcanivorax dieselolei (strain DSM 16502 / CGMCC 1.3690 / MCCC 1A00001 / B-5) TaxID=930169 RepID=K0CFE5_ALCDB|nr:hypothetical protein [Alloalcanivorax dieselolei]AFT70442.1 putative hydrolase or acyltransferase [Alloalcanivorax dieselolei B5]
MTLTALTVLGVRLEAAWFGPPPDQAATLVLLHEGLGCVALWKAFPQRRRVHRPDQCGGRGRSKGTRPGPEGRPSILNQEL